MTAKQLREARQARGDKCPPALRALYFEGEAILARAEANGNKYATGEQARLDEILALLAKPEARTVVEDPQGGTQRPEGGGMRFALADGREARALLPEDRLARPRPTDQPDLNLERYLRGVVLGDWQNADLELRAAQEGATGSLGGYLMPEQLAARVIDLARNQTRCIQAGAQTLPMQTGTVHIARIAGDPAAYWRAENVAVTESDSNFERVTLEAKTCGAIVTGSRELLDDSQVGTVIQEQLAKVLATALDAAGLMGSGVNSPLGVYYASGINEYSMGANGAAPTNYDPWAYAVQYCQQDNEEPSANILSPRTVGVLSRLKEATTNAYMEAPGFYTGLRSLATSQVPDTLTQGTETAASAAIVGDFRQLLFGMRKQVKIELTTEGGSDTFAKHQFKIGAFLRADVAVLRPAAFCKIVGLAA